MRRMCVGLAATALLAGLGSPVSAKMEMLTGLLVDEACYRADKANMKQKHAMKNGPMENCATSCAKKGQPVALVTSDGKLYVVVGQYTANKNSSLIPYMAHTVAMTGNTTTSKDGSATISAVSIKTIQ